MVNLVEHGKSFITSEPDYLHLKYVSNAVIVLIHILRETFVILLLLSQTSIHDFIYINLMRPGPFMANAMTEAHCCVQFWRTL